MSQTIVPIQPDQLKSVAQRSGLDGGTAEQLVSTLMPLAEQAAAIMDESAGVIVTDPSQVTEIKRSRECRLRLKEIRVSVEKCRKAIKEASLKRGQAIDAVAAFLRDKIEPEETRLEHQEKIAERMEAERLARVRQDRERLLAPYGVPSRFMDLARMPQAQFDEMLAGAKKQHEDRIERQRAEAEARRVAAEAEAAERARIKAENERLAAEADRARAAAAAARAEAERERRERERAESDRKAQECLRAFEPLSPASMAAATRRVQSHDGAVSVAELVAMLKRLVVAYDEARAEDQGHTLLSEARNLIARAERA